jgi:hypothetical protein
MQKEPSNIKPGINRENLLLQMYYTQLVISIISAHLRASEAALRATERTPEAAGHQSSLRSVSGGKNYK